MPLYGNATLTANIDRSVHNPKNTALKGERIRVLHKIGRAKDRLFVALTENGSEIRVWRDEFVHDKYG